MSPINTNTYNLESQAIEFADRHALACGSNACLRRIIVAQITTLRSNSLEDQVQARQVSVKKISYTDNCGFARNDTSTNR